MDTMGRNIYHTKGQVGKPFRFGGELSNGLYILEVRQGEEVKVVNTVKAR